MTGQSSCRLAFGLEGGEGPFIDYVWVAGIIEEVGSYPRLKYGGICSKCAVVTGDAKQYFRPRERANHLSERGPKIVSVCFRDDVRP